MMRGMIPTPAEKAAAKRGHYPVTLEKPFEDHAGAKGKRQRIA
jgi:hypothetical protein